MKLQFGLTSWFWVLVRLEWWKTRLTSRCFIGHNSDSVFQRPMQKSLYLSLSQDWHIQCYLIWWVGWVVLFCFAVIWSCSVLSLSHFHCSQTISRFHRVKQIFSLKHHHLLKDCGMFLLCWIDTLPGRVLKCSAKDTCAKPSNIGSYELVSREPLGIRGP